MTARSEEKEINLAFDRIGVTLDDKGNPWLVFYRHSVEVVRVTPHCKLLPGKDEYSWGINGTVPCVMR